MARDFWRLVLPAAFVCAVTTIGRAQVGHRPLETTPRVLIECFRTTDSLSSEITLLLRRELQARVPIEQMYLLSTDGIIDWDPPPRPWQWSDLRDVALMMRLDVVVDISATPSPDGIQVVVERLLRPKQSKHPVLMTRVTAPTVQAVVDSLARRLMSDTLLNRPLTR